MVFLAFADAFPQQCTVKLFNAKTGAEVSSLRGLPSFPTATCFLGRDRLLVGTIDGVALIFDLSRGTVLRSLAGHQRRVNACAALDSNGKLAATAAWDGALCIWSTLDGELVRTVRQASSPINCITVNPDGFALAYGAWDGRIHIYDFANMKHVVSLPRQGGSVRSVAYSPSGRHIAAGCSLGTVSLWSTNLNEHVGSFKAHDGPLSSISYSLDGLDLFTSGADGRLRAWSSFLGTAIPMFRHDKGAFYVLPTGVGAHHPNVDTFGPIRSLKMSPKEHWAAVGCADGMLQVVDLATGAIFRPVRAHSLTINAVAWSASEKVVATASSDNTCALWAIEQLTNTKTGRAAPEATAVLTGHSAPVSDVAISRHLSIATASEDCTVGIWQANGTHIRWLRGHESYVTAVAFSTSDPLLLASGSRDTNIIIWNVNTFNATRTIRQAHKDWITSILFNDTIVSASVDFTAKQWTIAGSSVTCATMAGHMSSVNCLSSQNKEVLTGSSDGTLKLWNEKGSEKTTLSLGSVRVMACAIGRDGHLVLAGSEDGSMYAFEPTQAQLHGSVNAHALPVTDIVVVPSMHGTLVSSGMDGELKVWSASDLMKSGAPLAGCKHMGAVSAVLLCKTNQVLVSASRAGDLIVWRLVDGGPRRVASASLPTDAAINTLLLLSETHNDEIHFASGASNGEVSLYRVSLQAGGAASLTLCAKEKLGRSVTALDFAGKHVVASTWVGRFVHYAFNTKGEGSISVVHSAIPGLDVPAAFSMRIHEKKLVATDLNKRLWVADISGDAALAMTETDSIEHSSFVVGAQHAGASGAVIFADSDGFINVRDEDGDLGTH